MHRFFLPAALALSACATLPTAAAGPTAGLGQAAPVGELRVRPLRVIEDSRCPINARCVWAGRMILNVAVRVGNRESRHDLTLGEPLPVGRGRLVLVSAEPGRVAGRETDPRAYRFGFELRP